MRQIVLKAPGELVDRQVPTPKFLVVKRCFEYSESAFVAAISMPSLADTLPIPILVCWAMNWQAKSLRLVLTRWALEQVIVARLTHM